MERSYTEDDFKARLKKVKKLYCSDDLNYGLSLYPTRYALPKKYIQLNNDKTIMFLVIDLDHQNKLIYQDVGLPEPNFIVSDKTKGTSHYIYALRTPIYKNYIENQKALVLFAKIQQEYTRLLKGDPLYVGLIAKNPLNENWLTWNLQHFHAYDLTELSDYIQIPKTISKRDAIGEGRNCFLFDSVRKIAYREVLFYKSNGATESEFFNFILNKVENANSFLKSPPLEFNELKNIAKSISKWTWKNFSTEIFSEIQRKRNSKNKLSRQKKNNIGELKNELFGIS
ncbi:replication initiation protein [Haemophilus parainfluenzae]|jgi:recombination associated protein|uniref:replication initiation protein n=3 Tax=Haemophilus parainfluenzae TaxID=729 RepID=UPI000DFF2720|nr:replication initiation protein [Haemophilus parainfluenzae]STP00274.1 Replicase family [Haemophilus parainfluenzae ATCC 33392]